MGEDGIGDGDGGRGKGGKYLTEADTRRRAEGGSISFRA